MPKLPLSNMKQSISVTNVSAVAPIILNISGNRVRIRTARSTDATEAMAAWLSDPAVVMGLNSNGQKMNVAMLSAYINSFDNVRKNLAVICASEDNSPLGLLMFDIEPRHRIGSFHIVVGDRQNLRPDRAYHALRLLFKYMFEQRKVEKISIEPLSRNVEVVRSCQWLGITLEGILRSHRADSRTNERLDQHVFGMTRAEYLSWPHRLV